MTRPDAPRLLTVEEAAADLIAEVARLRDLGATCVEIKRTRGGTVLIKATWTDAAPAPRPMRAR
jgi:hypothetical protein